MGSSTVPSRSALAAACFVCVCSCSTAPDFGEGTGGAPSSSSSAIVGPSGPGSGGATDAASSQSASGGDGGDGDGGTPGSGGSGGDGGGGDGGAGEGGGGGATTDGSSSAMSSTSSGCVPDCGDRRCGPDGCDGSCGPEAPTWAVTLPVSAAELVVHEPSSSVFVTTDISGVGRFDSCDGEMIEYVALPDESPRGVAVIGDLLMVATNQGSALWTTHRFDRRTLDQPSPPMGMPGAAADDLIWTGVAHAGDLWLSMDQDGDGLIRVPPAGAAERYDFGPYGLGRGVASTDYGLAMMWGTKQLAIVDTSTCAAGGCAEPTVSEPHAVLPYKLASDGEDVFMVSFEGSVGTLMRTSAVTASLGPVVTRDPSPDLDGWVDVAVFGGVVYASGVSSGITGFPWIVLYPTAFAEGAPPMLELGLAGAGEVAWAIAVDADGVYVAGSRSAEAGGGGFLLKCTPRMVCPEVP